MTQRVITTAILNSPFEEPRKDDILKVPPISEHGNIMEIAEKFGGAEPLREAVNELEALIYAA